MFESVILFKIPQSLGCQWVKCSQVIPSDWTGCLPLDEAIWILEGALGKLLTDQGISSLICSEESILPVHHRFLNAKLLNGGEMQAEGVVLFGLYII